MMKPPRDSIGQDYGPAIAAAVPQPHLEVA